jgi:hypothetical protein
VTGTGPDGKTGEFWCSPAKDISATRQPDWIEFRDHRLRTYYWYDVGEGVLYRVPEDNPRRHDDMAATVAALRVLLHNGQPVDKPLERLGFLRDGRADMTVLQQKLEQVEEGGRKWLDYRLTVRSRQPEELEEMLFRADPETKLLQLCRMKGRTDGKPVVAEMRFDYPEKGPADVYDLGVPKTAKLVDRVPSGDIRRIMEAHRAGRQRMDNYRAFLIQYADGQEFTSWSCLEVLYRKGDKFRRDGANWKPAEMRKMAFEVWPNVAKGEDNQKIAAWWGQQMDKLYCQPMCIVCGSSHYYDIRWRSVKAADGSDHVEVESVEKRPGMSLSPGDPWPSHYYSLPEFVCRPALGIPSQWMEPVIDLNPKEGPPGTILLRVRRSARMPGSSAKLPEGVWNPDSYRYWLDPARDYAAVRWDMLGGGEPGKEEITDSTVIEEMARSPQGTWYATRFRRKSSATGPNGEKIADQVHYFYVQFDVDLPDSLFEPPKPGDVLSWR